MDQLVECIECADQLHNRSECYQFVIGGSSVPLYLCPHHTMRYKCDLCGAIEYTAECRATHWCQSCAARMDDVADDIIADFEMRSIGGGDVD